ncbi:MAG TPA: serine hydrolase domain-containing protein, partial [Blastocatellia bacterium]|nr:serine hydrolase domain-containing protein [Blastocatellia bacterium]
MTKPVAWKFSVAGLLVGALLVPAAARVARPPEVTEERVKAALPALEKLAAQTLTQTGVPGMAIAVVYQDRPVYLKGFGVREAGRDAPVDPDTIFQIASVSKPVTTTIVARLVGEGLVKWDDPIIKHDPQFRMHDPDVTREVTLRDFFAHRSGLPDHIGDLLEDIGSSREEVLTALRYV